jgi:hypothetical protein
MNLRALLLIGGLGLATLASAQARDKRPRPETNPNVKRAVKKAKKFKPTAKYKAPKKSRKPPAATRGVKHV